MLLTALTHGVDAEEAGRVDELLADIPLKGPEQVWNCVQGLCLLSGRR